jgi:trk system potassium uptake protein TrkH
MLLVGGAALFLVSDGGGFSGDRLWEATFNSVTARTAGFNITDFGAYGFASVVLFCFLMFVGGSPGGTAGGVKTTTFAVAVGELIRLIRGHASLHLRDRRIPRDLVERCTATVVMSLIWVTVSIFAVSWSHPNLDPVDVTFECFSAFGTVGLSRGITADLNAFGQIVIIANMFAGRVGLLTLVLTLAGRPRPRHYELPEGRLPLN